MEKRVLATPSDRSGPPERERLIESHLPLVRAIARRYDGRGEPLEDLVQVGAMALVRASDRFDPERGVAFASFATPAIEGEIQRHLGDRSGSVRIPREVRRMSGRLRRARTQLSASLGRPPTLEELASALGVEPEELEPALQAERAREPSSEMSDDAIESTRDAGSLQATDDRLLLAASSQVLDERERRIVLLRFHADLTEREIAREVGISQAQVSRVLSRALTKLRGALEDENRERGAGDTTENPVISAENSVAEGEMSGQTDQETRVSGTAEAKIAAVDALEEQAHPTKAQPPPNVDVALPYHVTVKAEGEGWVASFEELPGTQSRGDTPEQATENLRSAMEGWISAAVDDPRVISPPKRRPSRRSRGQSPSGRFLVRMDSELHEQLTRAAEREQVSLNRYVTERLAASVAPGGKSAPGRESAPAPTHAEPQTSPPRRLRVLLAANVAIIILAAAAAIALLILALERGI